MVEESIDRNENYCKVCRRFQHFACMCVCVCFCPFAAVLSLFQIGRNGGCPSNFVFATATIFRSFIAYRKTFYRHPSSHFPQMSVSYKMNSLFSFGRSGKCTIVNQIDGLADDTSSNSYSKQCLCMNMLVCVVYHAENKTNYKLSK